MSNGIKDFVSWLGIIGIPSIFTMTLWCIKACTTFFNQLKILSQAQKAQMRAQLLDKYYEIKERSFIWSDELEEWINSYDAYHKLVGANGVLDARKDELLKMPTKAR